MRKTDGVAMTILLLASSVCDLKSYQIPNYLIVSGWLSGLAFRLQQAGISGMGDGFVCIIISILLLLPLFRYRMVGAGDVKLLSVISGFYGVAFWAKTGVVFLFLAGIAAVIQMFRKRLFAERFRYVINYVLYNRKDRYYVPERDGRKVVIPMAPFLTVAYYFVWLSGGRGF